MKRLLRTALLPAALLGLTLLPSTVLASGFGAYADVGAGNFSFTVSPDGGEDETVDGSASSLGLGIVYDSNCAGSGLLNYRLNAGYQAVTVNPDDWSEDESFGFIGIDNTLGFGLVTNETMRLWIGPQVRVGYAWGTGDALTDDATAVVYGIGAAVGLNYHLGQDYDISFMAGARNDWYTGDFSAPDTTDGNFDGTATYGYFNVSFLWRSLDDKYGAK